ncbi:LuxR C-terminal-related transcriptional regulator [Nocardia pseudovaccinii]|uniref:LuxR C-terminal-related transcriptional regulator n=1 Tax=Nocardia pseudovaccinii TaxID=189540 RepID=UPI0007C6533C|nr:LuxR C-terminal-related transcriptional regulator [Nocardia pseudovaccinii]
MGARLVGNLPSDVTSFVGRERELTKVRHCLSSGRIVTLIGPGGVGKTRLALRVAAETYRAFPDGIWLVELAQLRDADLLAVEIAMRLGLENNSGDPLESLTEYLRNKNLLLVLDNCEHLVQPVATVLSRLVTTAPALRVLTTSRQVLGVEGEHLFEVPALSLPEEVVDRVEPGRVSSEAVELFLDRAAAVVPELPADVGFHRSVIELCRRLDGIPLAIELAAARLRAYPVEEILARVGRALDVLTTGPRSAPTRHRALKATIGWSFALCSPSEQLMWARLSVFAGGFDLAAAEGVCSDDRLPRIAMFDLLADLVDKSILQRTPGSARFSMLETVREYGLEHLAAIGEVSALRLAHARYFAALAFRGYDDYFSEREIAWFREVGRNHANLRLAMQWYLAELGEPRVVLRIASSLRLYWASPGVLREGYQWLRKALADSPEPSEERAEALWVCACMEMWMADTASADRTMAECRALAEKLAMPWLDAALLLCVVGADFVSGDAPAAFRHARDAVVAGRRVGRPTITGEALFYVSSMAFASGDAAAADFAAEALGFLESEKAQLWRAYALWINGLVRCRRDEPDTAPPCFLEALTVFEQLCHQTGVALCLDGLAWVAALSGDFTRAARLLGTAGSIWETGPRRMMPYRFSELLVKGKVETIVRAGLGDARFEAAARAGSLRKPQDAVWEVATSPEAKSEPVPSGLEDPLAVLTRRERRVAELLANGLSNREIAADLVLSTRTVESHVQNILNKLGFHSRAQVASLIGRLGSEV